MKITDMRTYVVNAERGRTWLFVEVISDAGEMGIGEASQSRFDAGVQLQIELMKEVCLGRHPLDLIEPLRRRFLHNPFANRINYAAWSGIEQALWDLAGKATGEPLHRLLGGAMRDRLRLYANINAAKSGDSPEQLAETAARAVKEGFTAVKMYPFIVPEQASTIAGAPISVKEGALAVERVRAVRSAIGPDIDLLCDWAWNLTPGDARRLADDMTEFELFWIEEPFVEDDPIALAEFRARIGPRLAGGEQLSGANAFRALFEARSLDVLMPDVKWIGGIAEMRNVSATAATYDVEIAPHNMSGPVATAAALHLGATLGNFCILEYCWGSVPWRADLVNGSERVEDGYLVLSDTPGLGVDWRAAVARANGA